MVIAIDQGLAYSETGGRAGPVVLLHGWAAGSRVWAGVLANLHGRVHALAPDLPGHGSSDLRVAPGLSVSEAAVREFSRWCASRDVLTAPMVAWAWGSQVLIAAMSRGWVAPESVFLVCHVVDPSTPDPYEGPLARDWARYSRSIARMLTAAPLSPEKERWLSRLMFSTSVAAAGGVHAAQLPPPADGLVLPPHSVGLIGLQDPIVDADAVRCCLGDWGAKVVEMSECGHVPFLERPSDFQDVLEAWMVETGVLDASGV